MTWKGEGGGRGYDRSAIVKCQLLDRHARGKEQGAEVDCNEYGALETKHRIQQRHAGRFEKRAGIVHLFWLRTIS